MKEFDLNRIKRLIEEKFNWGPSGDWTNFHFKELKNAIEKETGDNLSEETLKRIFGKRKVATNDYQPQAFTKLAIIKFAERLQPESPLMPEKRFPIQWKKFLVLTMIPVILIVTLFLVTRKEKAPEFTFACDKRSELAPFTASFKYDVSNIKDSVFANFGYWGENYLSPQKNIINFFYRMPGVYNVRLYTRSKVLDSFKIWAYSSDWQGGYYPNRADSLFEPFIDQEFFRHDGFFYADPDPLLFTEGVNLREKYYTAYRLFLPFTESLDSLSLEARVQNNASTGSMLCYDTGLQLIGKSGMIDFNLTQSRCSRFAGIRVSEKYLSGEDTDLNSLAVDMSDWLDLKIENVNKEFNLYLDNQLLLKQQYENPLGKLIGIVIYFSGSGKVEDLKVFDGEHRLFYSYDFSKPQ